jgi:hypothetical protein
MSKRNVRRSFDVFLAHDPLDNALAQAVIERLQADRVTAFSAHLTESQPLDPVSEAVRRELLDSFGLAVLLTPAFHRSDFLPFYAGAAAIQRLPLFVLTSGVRPDQVPGYLSGATCGELWGGLPAVAVAMREQATPFSADRTQVLLDSYRALGVSADTLRTDAEARDRLARAFNTKARARVPTARVLRELARLRKSGQLPRLTSRASK